MSATTCICFVSDEGYLFPRSLVAIQARAAAPPETAEVAIFLIGRNGGAVARTLGVVRWHERGSAKMNRTASVCRESVCIASGTRFRPAFAMKGRPDAPSASLRSFFVSLDDPLVLRGVMGPCADVGKAERLQKRSDIAVVKLDAEALLDDVLRIDASPAHDAGALPIRAASTIFASSANCSVDRGDLGPSVQLFRGPSRAASLALLW